MNSTPSLRDGSRLRKAVSLTALLLLCGCASTPRSPTASLQQARQAIATAEQAQAGHYAPGELSDARTHLASANSAVTVKQMIAARQFAEESTADAELATAKTADIKAHAVNDEMKRSTATLIQETQRSSGASQ